MVRHTLIKLAAIAMLVGTSGIANAYDGRRDDRLYGNIQAERDRQQAAIARGREDGSLTWYEKLSLNREQARIERMERDALADGNISRDEFRSVRQAQEDAARHIANERHDPQVRGWWWRLWH